MAEVRGEKLEAEKVIGEAITADEMSEDEVRALILGMGDILSRLAKANPEQKAILYRHLGIKLTYRPEDRTVLVESRPACATQRVGGASCTLSTCVLRGELRAA